MAERKIRGILAAAGRVRLVSPAVTPSLTTLADYQAIEWWCKPYSRPDLDGAFLVFAATDNAEVQQAVHRDAQAAGLLVNVADNPGWCDFQIPATIRRGDLSISVATGGKSPAVAAMVKRRLDQLVGEEYGWLTALAALLREQILAEGLDSERMRMLFQQLLHDDIVDWLRDRRWCAIRQHVEQILGRPVHFDPESLIKENP
ncbi:MAG: bifunctional precorrin-2 dehydrogenase/sirohydrochlorin ferrochelatase [Desulfobulbus sp.]|nr:bifunctional precorrin-2 dehydrogenase/sirohydrochlorin ferrochelatase [Desulfobulbus sp.]